MDPNAATPDVNTGPAPSAEPGVPAASPAAIDVTPAPSAGTDVPPPETPHEEKVPYERLKESLDKNKELQAQLDAALGAAAGAPEPSATPETPPAQAPLDWASLGFTPPAAQEAVPQQIQQGPISTPEEVEQRIRDDMYNKPYATFAPIIIELAKQVVSEQKKAEAQVRGMPGFQQVESSYYNIPDNVVQQAQNNPEVIRYLIARNANPSAAQPTPPPNLQVPPAALPTAPISDPNNPPKTMDELKQQYIAEGERLALEKLRKQQGLTAEGAGSIPSAGGDKPELDADGKAFMRKLGLGEDKYDNVAKRLQFSGGNDR